MLKQTLLYTGKAKSVYETDSADHLILVFRDMPLRSMAKKSNN
ncbi:phosphoribosylaminoimidazole-succinocarboxamide synthase domain protein [Acinetobacter sp. 1294596]|nr:phosphoribosylaminoimidazole-succinocarboxamide synthase domain protein [Acinetobacter sp. 1294596]